jgi:hypothetical protein
MDRRLSALLVNVSICCESSLTSEAAAVARLIDWLRLMRVSSACGCAEPAFLALSLLTFGGGTRSRSGDCRYC